MIDTYIKLLVCHKKQYVTLFNYKSKRYTTYAKINVEPKNCLILTFEYFLSEYTSEQCRSDISRYVPESSKKKL